MKFPPKTPQFASVSGLSRRGKRGMMVGKRRPAPDGRPVVGGRFHILERCVRRREALRPPAEFAERDGTAAEGNFCKKAVKFL
jgi:hypothetical protein